MLFSLLIYRVFDSCLSKNQFSIANKFSIQTTIPVELELLTCRSTWVNPPVFSGVCVTQSLVFFVVFCRSLFVPLFFVSWPLGCLSFVLRILINPLLSSYSSSYRKLEFLFKWPCISHFCYRREYMPRYLFKYLSFLTPTKTEGSYVSS
jgi:hypothetical protein